MPNFPPFPRSISSPPPRFFRCGRLSPQFPLPRVEVFFFFKDLPHRSWRLLTKVFSTAKSFLRFRFASLFFLGLLRKDLSRIPRSSETPFCSFWRSKAEVFFSDSLFVPRSGGFRRFSFRDPPVLAAVVWLPADVILCFSFGPALGMCRTSPFPPFSRLADDLSPVSSVLPLAYPGPSSQLLKDVYDFQSPPRPPTPSFPCPRESSLFPRVFARRLVQCGFFVSESIFPFSFDQFLTSVPLTTFFYFMFAFLAASFVLEFPAVLTQKLSC